MPEVEAVSRYPCPVCEGFRGWGRSSGHPAPEPEHGYSRTQWVRCMFCNGHGMVLAYVLRGPRESE